MSLGILLPPNLLCVTYTFASWPNQSQREKLNYQIKQDQSTWDNLKQINKTWFVGWKDDALRVPGTFNQCKLLT